jgi:hypothetical protein
LVQELFSIRSLLGAYMMMVVRGRGERGRRRPAYKCTIVGDFDVLVQVQDRAALGQALGRGPDCLGRAGGEEEKGKARKQW